MQKPIEGWRVKAAPVDAICARRDVERLRQYFISKYAYGRSYALMVTLGCNFGLRAGDLLRLTVGDVRGKTHLVINERKTGKERRIFINGKARAALDEEINRYLWISDHEPLFRCRKGKTLTVKSFHRLIKDGCKAIGLQGNYGSHSLRKTFARQVYERTGDIKKVQKMMNHSDMSVTRVYVSEEKNENKNEEEYKEDEVYSVLNI